MKGREYGYNNVNPYDLSEIHSKAKSYNSSNGNFTSTFKPSSSSLLKVTFKDSKESAQTTSNSISKTVPNE